MARWDAVVVGSGPNGLAAAVAVAEQGFRVVVLEASETIGGGTRTEELTLPGFRHDVCSAFHPLGIASPFFGGLPMERLGVRWILPEVQVAHPFEDGSAAALWRSLDTTCDRLGRDGDRWRQSVRTIVEDWTAVAPAVLEPVTARPFPPLRLASWALPAALFAGRFRAQSTKALFAGLAAHGMRRLDAPATAAVGIVLGALAHVGGWPLVEGGSSAITTALAAHLGSLGGEVRLDHRVRGPGDLPASRVVLLDTHPRGLLEIYGERIVPASTRRRFARYRQGAAAYKIDYALDAPVPWTARECARAGVVHLGGTYSEVVATGRAVEAGAVPDRPFVLVGQQSLFDPTRAPAGKHTLWTYTHVPAGFEGSVKDRVEAQIERFAPGFRDIVLASHVTTPHALEAYNPNYRGGDIATGAQTLRRLLGRPGPLGNPYRTGLPGVYLCSAATPPGPGVHGMCGANAAASSVREYLASGVI